MPIVDLPLSLLHEYAGRNPRPEDFDAYWDRALEEMRATDPAVELVPHPLNAPFALERFTHGYLIDEHGAAGVAH